MNKFRHIVGKEKKLLSITVIPSESKNIIQFNLPYWLPIFSIILILSLTAGTIFYYRNFNETNQQLTLANNTILNLKMENNNQENEIHFLKNRTAEIESNLVELYDLQSRVYNLVGLEAEASEATDSSKDNEGTESFILASRSATRDPIFNTSNDDENIILDDLIEKQKKNMQKLIVDVEEQLKYIDSLPNLVPTKGKISSGYGYRISPINRRREFHSGVDIANKTNTEILAAGSGIVTFAGYNGAYGRMVIISHGYGYTSVYAHNSSILVKVGDKVIKGDTIAKMGSTGRSTGPHLHFEIRENGVTLNPVTLLEDL
ncbi:M23 family metallopeptidase [Alkaliphilus serpentinus]|uniref:M23 family metallopeptidase n=1 Tax=Alkaliphilus serpentinus TaxID=1482731 RepID=A0A833M943_9FIRM|nr:M23 family metallopeptidase [Alkaliphilus serpentinus]KAB3529031.1 M23 family metallopeptidase [Alkaliphilus serpentinus]